MINKAGKIYLILAKNKLENREEHSGILDVFMALRLLILFLDGEKGAKTGSDLAEIHYKICRAEDLYKEWRKHYPTNLGDGKNATPNS